MFRPRMLRKAWLPVSIAAMSVAFAAYAHQLEPVPQHFGYPPFPHGPAHHHHPAPRDADDLQTATPIKHLVVIFDENRSFDHYFGTYPVAANPPGEPAFHGSLFTPRVQGLNALLRLFNPNKLNAANGVNAVNPFRLDRTQANTEGQSHAYTAEQLAYDDGKADLFPLHTGNNTVNSSGAFGTHGLVMGYYDGNTVTALWNYAQHFAMDDNAYTDTYGPSTPGAIHVVSGTTNGATFPDGTHPGGLVADGQGSFGVVGDPDPVGDVCSSAGKGVRMTSRNIGDLLSASNVSWGGFMGGFDLTTTNANGSTGCRRSTYSTVLGGTKTDYVPHHAWFQYYASTENPAHTRPTSLGYVGYDDPKDNTDTPVHHQYDINDFFNAVQNGNFPAVSYLKAPAVGDAHPGNSDPLDEQAFIVRVLNFLQKQPDWKHTAVIITYDDSDGWYDHRYASPTTSSFDADADQLNGPGRCIGPFSKPGIGVTGKVVNGRCGPGTRIPFVVVSPYARINYVSDVRLTQSSVVRFIEDNWLHGKRIGQGSNDAHAGSIMSMFDFTRARFVPSPKLYLDPDNGTPVRHPAPHHADQPWILPWQS